MTPSQKLRSIADSTGLDGIANAIREVADEIEHNNAPAVPFCYASVNKQGDVTSTHKRKDSWRTVPLYLAAPSQPGTLTDEEICECFGIDGADDWVFKGAHAIIAALREKDGK